MKKIFLIVLLLQFGCFCFGNNANLEKQSELSYLNLDFWEKFQDEILITNLQKGFENNIDLKIADLKVKESEKIVKLSLSQELPQINFEGMLGRTFASSNLERGSNNFMIKNYKLTRFLLPLSASYEIDIWGKNRLKTKSQKQNLKMLKEKKRAVYIEFSSAVAINYFNLIKTDELLKLELELENLLQKLLTLTENKHKSGLATLDDVLNIREEIVKNKEIINSLESNQEVLENQLSYLLGDKLFKKIERNNFKNIKTLENVPYELNSSIISARPDVIIAQENIKKADLEARIAKKELLPSFTIAGTLGFNGYNNFSGIFSSDTGLADLWVIPNLTVFDGARKYNLMKLKKLEFEQARKEYEKTLIASIQEVNDSLAVLKKEDKNYKLSKEILDIQTQKTALKQKSTQHGLTSEIDCILYQTAKNLAQQKFADDKINQIISSINLFQAAGAVDFTSNL